MWLEDYVANLQLCFLIQTETYNLCFICIRIQKLTFNTNEGLFLPYVHMYV